MRIFILSLMMGALAACANTNCRTQREMIGENKPPEIKKELDPMNKTSSADRVKVYKPDGSLQCGQGKEIPAGIMQAELKGITVHSSGKKNDGMMRIQVCGVATGNSNVYEIDRTQLAAALKLGFKEWTFE